MASLYGGMTMGDRWKQLEGIRAARSKQAWKENATSMIEVPVAGVTFGTRQKALERLTYYAPEEILTVLVAEPDNAYDKNAIAVKVLVRGAEKSYCIGYIPKTATSVIKPHIAKFPELRIICGNASYSAKLKIAV